MHSSLWLVVIFLVSSCSSGQLVIRHDPFYTWKDDGSGESLKEAVKNSIIYYERLPAKRRFKFGEEKYTPRQMIASLKFFLQTREEAKGPQDFKRKINKRFHVFESIPRKGDGLFTGYFEPLLEGRRKPKAGFTSPVFEKPKDLVEIHLRRFSSRLPKRKLVGRLQGGKLVPYFSRAEIQSRGKPLKKRAMVLAYVNEVDLFFLQIQGSGTVIFPDGEEMKINYQASNGHAYRSLGAEMVKRGIMEREEVTMQTIRTYLRENPEVVRPLLFTNPSYVFFRKVDAGPYGNIQVPLTPGRSLALDHRLFPKGALIYLMTEQPIEGETEKTQTLNRFMLVQDTGGAIRGHARGDVFWGMGEKASWLAGHMKFPGKLIFLVAKKQYLEPELVETHSNKTPYPNLPN